MRSHGALVLLGALVEVSESSVELSPGCAGFDADVALANACIRSNPTNCSFSVLSLSQLPHQTYATTNNDGPAIIFTCHRPKAAEISFTPFFLAQICFTAQSSHLHFVEVDWGDNSLGTKVGLNAEKGDIVCAPEDRFKYYIGSGQHKARMWINGVQVYESTTLGATHGHARRRGSF